MKVLQSSRDDKEVTVYLVAVLEYISADILKVELILCFLLIEVTIESFSTAGGHLREEPAGDAGHAAGHQGRHVRRQGKTDPRRKSYIIYQVHKRPPCPTSAEFLNIRSQFGTLLPLFANFIKLPRRLLKISPLPLNVDVLNGCLFDAFTEGSIMHRINHVSTITLFTPNSK